MSTSGVKIEIYTNNKKPLKKYTIGHSTSNHLGTYMLLDKGETPYIMHIPGFNGFLSPRYGIIGNRIDENKWRNTTIFNLNNKEIKNISVNHINYPDSSFYLSIDKKILFDNNQNKIPYNAQKVKQFINHFQKLNCEVFKKDKSILFNSNPIHIMIVNSDTLRTYEMNNSIIKKKEDNFNIQRMYATLNNGELMLIQNYVFNKVLITINELKE